MEQVLDRCTTILEHKPWYAFGPPYAFSNPFLLAKRSALDLSLAATAYNMTSGCDFAGLVREKGAITAAPSMPNLRGLTSVAFATGGLMT